MADDGVRWGKAPGPVTKVLRIIGVAALVHSLGDQELDAPVPKVVWHTDRSSRLRALAFRSAAEGRDDTEAVRELVRVAGRHAKELRRAAATIRVDAWVDEDLAAFRANRLLVAAATGRPVESVSAERLAWFGRVRALADVPPEEAPLAVAFAELVALEPALAELEVEVRAMVGSTEFAAMDGERRDGAVAGACDDRLEAIAEGTGAPLIRTHAARYIVRGHLCAIGGRPVPDPEPIAR